MKIQSYEDGKRKSNTLLDLLCHYFTVVVYLIVSVGGDLVCIEPLAQANIYCFR